MGFMDNLRTGAAVAAQQASKALDKGTTKANELQVQMKMDGAAKKLGYLEYDHYRGRDADQGLRQGLLDELSRLEGELNRIRQEAAAKAAAARQAADGAARATYGATTGGEQTTTGGWGQEQGPGTQQSSGSEGTGGCADGSESLYGAGPAK
jgi:hypothetical protein